MTTDLAVEPVARPRGRGKGLTIAQRDQLLEIISRSPSLSNRRIAELFTEATGRPLQSSAVKPYRSGRVSARRPAKWKPRTEPAPRDRSSWFPELAPAERSALIRLMDENPRLDALEIVALLAREVAP